MPTVNEILIGLAADTTEAKAARAAIAHDCTLDVLATIAGDFPEGDAARKALAHTTVSGISGAAKANDEPWVGEMMNLGDTVNNTVAGVVAALKP